MVPGRCARGRLGKWEEGLPEWEADGGGLCLSVGQFADGAPRGAGGGLKPSLRGQGAIFGAQRGVVYDLRLLAHDI